MRVASTLCWILCGFVSLMLIIKLVAKGLDLQVAYAAVIIMFFGFAAHGLLHGKRSDRRLAVVLGCLTVVSGLMGFAIMLGSPRPALFYWGPDRVGTYGAALLIPFAQLVAGCVLLWLLFLRETRAFCNK